MTRSLFDPAGDPEEGGSMFTLPDADQISHLPDMFRHPVPAEPDTGEPSAELGQLAAAEAAHERQQHSEPAALQVVSENDGKLLVIRITGKLHKIDYEHFAPTVEKAVQKHGKVRMLVQLETGIELGFFRTLREEWCAFLRHPPRSIEFRAGRIRTAKTIPVPVSRDQPRHAGNRCPAGWERILVSLFPTPRPRAAHAAAANQSLPGHTSAA